MGFPSATGNCDAGDTTPGALTVRPTSRPTSPSPGTWVLAVGVCGCVVALFAPRLAELAEQYWFVDPNYSHSLLVLPVSLFLGWRVWRRQEILGRGVAWGLPWLVSGCLAHLSGAVIGWPPVDFFALSGVLFGLALLAGGWQWARGFWFPILFLGFLFPLPVTWANTLAAWLQGVVTTLATLVLGLFLPAYREGSLIRLPGHTLEVGEACSGVRQLIAFAALTCLAAYLSRRSVGYRLLLVSSAPFVALAANLMRVLLMAAVVGQWGERWILGAYHQVWGVLTMIAGLGLFAAFAWWLARLLPEENPGAVRTRDSDSVEPGGPGARGPRNRKVGLGLCVLVLSLAGESTLKAHLEAGRSPDPPELQEPLSGVPVSLGAWLGKDILPDTLPLSARTYFDAADDKLYRQYLLPGGERPPLRCTLWMIHFRDGRDRLHQPPACYRAAGLEEDRSRRTELILSEDGTSAERFCFTGQGGACYVYYWRYTPVTDPVPGLSPWQWIYLRRTRPWPSVTVEVVSAPRTEADRQEVTAFARQVHRHLRRHLPPSGRSAREALPVRLPGDGP